ncbi:hydrogenase nickel incorporation protein HypB [Desulfovermiculus halophilus]|jgi:hydrogenase nickel incorporation protein HypB|uniref:hydrogenase nickel incorporation protein HypB n=1 Tax=Desulfovermiculus halophilus TaxID=339722 RepID=UPI000556B0DF|nr:hydrogenase nickel incorporation protein HypB [Desulfovermiculus halophilus]
MTDDIRLIEVKEGILAQNEQEADQLRASLRAKGVLLLNLMASPGAGKTSLIVQTVQSLAPRLRIGVIEADIDSSVDAETVTRAGVQAVQLRTGGFCHLDAAMVARGVEALDTDNLDLIIVENVGNLVCPAEFDTGAHASAMILSVPEGDDKPLKYPLMFTKCRVLVVNKIDALSIFDFDLDVLRERAGQLNPELTVLPLSCKTGQGMQGWIQWLAEEVRAHQAYKDA